MLLNSSVWVAGDAVRWRRYSLGGDGLKEFAFSKNVSFMISMYSPSHFAETPGSKVAGRDSASRCRQNSHIGAPSEEAYVRI